MVLKSHRQRGAALALASILAIATGAHAQTYHVLHTFTRQGDGGNPTVGVTINVAGNLYGTTSGAGNGNSGLTYELKQHGEGWISPRCMPSPDFRTARLRLHGRCWHRWNSLRRYRRWTRLWLPRLRVWRVLSLATIANHTILD